jgi:hypothetical protein
MKTFKLSLLFLFSLFFKNTYSQNSDSASASIIHSLVEQLSQAIMQDGFNPPQASRIYAYCNIAAFEALINSSEKYYSLGKQLNGLGELPKPDSKLKYDFRYSAVVAFSKVARALVYRRFITDAAEKELLGKLEKETIEPKIIENSAKYGNELADFIIAWIKQDNFTQLKTMQRYELKGTPGTWQPTPPAYMDALEPNWNKIRPLVMKTADQFKPASPYEFSTDTASDFYKQNYFVYKTVNELSPENLEISKYWDDSPVHNEASGHFMYVSRKLSPGGHWLNIVKIVAKDVRLDILESSRVYALSSIALYDGFISCWDEKYRSNLVRPETYITKYIDSNWSPVFETPPFPEHTSGHAVISNAVATILTNLIGDKIAFVDSTEVPFDLPARKFNSFHEAASEASVSRIYAGIHYMRAMSEGERQGIEIARYVLQNLATKKD